MEERGKPYSFCQGQLSNCLILWNKDFELRNLNLAVSFGPAELLCIQVVLLFPSWVALIPNLKLNSVFLVVVVGKGRNSGIFQKTAGNIPVQLKILFLPFLLIRSYH